MVVFSLPLRFFPAYWKLQFRESTITPTICSHTVLKIYKQKSIVNGNISRYYSVCSLQGLTEQVNMEECTERYEDGRKHCYSALEITMHVILPKNEARTAVVAYSNDESPRYLAQSITHV